MSTTISIIPARGGSKRVPGKNLRELAGMPLIGWSIQSSQASRGIHHHIVSTDSEEIASVATSFGARVEMRPAELATDLAGTVEVCQYLVRSLESQGMEIDTVVLLQPTSPFRQTKDIEEAILAVRTGVADMALGVSPVKAGPEWQMAVEDGYLSFPFRNDFNRIRSQEQPVYFRPNGSLYVYQRDVLMGAGKYAWGEKVLPIQISSPYDLDIDYETDFRIAEAIAHADFQNW